jgi:hypothetical protein
MTMDFITLKDNIKILAGLQKIAKQRVKMLYRIQDTTLAAELQKCVNKNKRTLRLMHVLYSMKKGRSYKEVEPNAKNEFDVKQLKRLVKKIKDKPVVESINT